MSESIFFYIFAGLAVLMILLMILQQNPVASALCLVFALFCLSGLYVLLSASFVAILQILVYAGAVMVLFVFVIMLLNLKKEDLIDDRVGVRHAVPLLVGFAFAGFLGSYFFKLPPVSFPEVAADFGNAQPVGKLMFTNYLVPFELISFLLLAAIVGVVLMGKKS